MRGKGALKPQIVGARRIALKPSKVRSGSLVYYVGVFLGAQLYVNVGKIISVGTILWVN